MINLSGTDSIIECMHGESLPEDVVRMYCYIQVDVCNGCNIDGSGAVYGAGFVSQDVLLHLSILIVALAVLMMVVMLVIFVILVMKLFCCFYMQIKSSGYYFTQVIVF